MHIDAQLPVSATAPSAGSDRSLFPCAPPWWQSCLSLPDETDKVLAGREGSLLFDYERGGTGHRSFRTVIEPGQGTEMTFFSQTLLDPKVPIVRTQLDAGEVRLGVETFCVTPPDAQFDGSPDLLREGGEEGFSGWDGPKLPRTKRKFSKACMVSAPEFSTVAWGPEGREIVYHWNTEPGTACEVVLGFAEGEHAEPGKRVLEIEVDGAAVQSVDPVAAFGFDAPGLVRIQAKDDDADGRIRIAVRAARDSSDAAAFLAAIWIFRGAAPSDEVILGGASEPTAFVDCGTSSVKPRQVLMRLDFSNLGDEAAAREPVLTIRSCERVRLVCGELSIGSRTRVLSDCGIRELVRVGDVWQAKVSTVLIPPGEVRTVFVTVNRHGYDSVALSEEGFAAKRAVAEQCWRELPLPFGRIRVPDFRIQALIDSSIRNIYQARDLQNGLPAFHVGPTCYRQLWIIDGAFLLEMVTVLGRKEEARAGIEYMLSFQLEDGSFQLKRRHWKEAGIVLWAVVRHARLSQDKEWLRSYWPKIEKAVAFIHEIRTRERAGEPDAPEFGLTPWGDCDGGFSNLEEHEHFPEYSNSYWLMSGLKAIVEAAAWIGAKEQAEAWAVEYQSFRATFDRAAARDMRTDSHGNRYLPILMHGDILPQKAQWPFCHAVYPGGIFESGDPFVTEMLKMLEAVEVEGLTFDTGWMSEGLWTYFASFLAHAQLWNGNGPAAYAALQAFADHSAPVLVWREEQKPVGKGFEEVGDMPHNWASAEFVRLALHLLILERGDELHFLEGVPAEWLHEGAALHASGIVTVFGAITLRVRVENHLLHVESNAPGFACSAIVLHLNGWRFNADPIRLPGNQPVQLQIPRVA